jgi:predicted negative regulator of RcsB-dependent stress response
MAEEEYLTDDEQWERVKLWFLQNGVWLIAGVVLGAALLFGWRHFDSYRNERALRAAAQFGQMAAALESNDRNKSRQIATALIKDYPSSPYADQAQLMMARLFIDDGQLAQAVAPLTQVMNNSKDGELKHIARLRLARVLIDQGKPDEAIKTLTAETSGPFASRAHEIRGDAFYAKKDATGALTEYKAALGGGDAGGVDSALLELKLADLATPAAPIAAIVPQPATPAADPSNKAKP